MSGKTHHGLRPLGGIFSSKERVKKGENDSLNHKNRDDIKIVHSVICLLVHKMYRLFVHQSVIQTW